MSDWPIRGHLEGNDLFAINFYSSIYADQLRKRRKTNTIRLGDESSKYIDGQITWITVGPKYGPRQKLFSAILDSVEVKPIRSLSRNDIKKENPEFRCPEEVLDFLVKLYDRPLTLDDVVTVIYFSEIHDHPGVAASN